MRNEEVERKIKNAVTHTTPDVLDHILSQCETPERNVYIIHPGKRKSVWARAAAGLAAAVVLVFGGLFAYQWIGYNSVAALVTLDVNPSIEIETNKSNRVIHVDAKNDDAVNILDDMDLKDTQINVAINALVGSMLKHGYIRENANSVLLSVEGADSEQSAALQRDLAESISLQLNAVNGAVISLVLTDDATLHQLAEEHQISYGKAALVQKIIAENNHLVFSDLATLSVNELNLLVASKRIAADEIASQGNASDADFIGEEAAQQIALEHAGISENEVNALHVELDYDDGTIVYEVEFVYDDREHEYEIDARDGSIIEYDQETPTGSGGPPPKTNASTLPPQTQETFIGEEKAMAIVENDSGFQSYAALEVELDKDDGLYVYEIEFYVEDKEYNYEINAVTGEMISFEVE